MKKFLLLMLSVTSYSMVSAQQDRQFTHYSFDRMSFNPATTGFKGYCGTAIYRNQWDRVQDAPISMLINLQGNIPRHNMGAGVSYTYDAIGNMRNNVLKLSGAYHLVTTAGILSGGLSVGFQNIGFNPVWIPPTDAPDPNIPAGISETAFNMDAGLYFHGRQPYYLGISATNLLPYTLQDVSFKTARHYYILGGYNIHMKGLSNKYGKRIDLKPSFLVKADGATMIFDINLMGEVWLNQYTYLWTAVSYRLSDGIPIMAGIGWSPRNNPGEDMLKFGYSFDIMTNAMNPYGRGTHELMLSYCIFPPRKPDSRFGNPFILQ